MFFKSRKMNRVILLLIVITGSFSTLQAQEWWFWPDYTLDQKAYNYPGNRIVAPVSSKPPIKFQSKPIIFHGEEPTERIVDFAPTDQLTMESFSIEMWTVNHVNQPIGVLATLKNRDEDIAPDWLVGFYGKTITAILNAENSLTINHEVEVRRRGNYWNYIVATYDGLVLKLYLNGELVKEKSVGKRAITNLKRYELEVASYMKNEPYMDLGNMLKMLRLENFAITSEEINNRHKVLLTMVEEGKLFPNLFHFNAGPYLNNATSTSMDIVWETDRPSDFVIMYGKQVPLMHKEEINTQSLLPEQKVGSNIYSITLDDLDPETPYFYSIMAKAHDGTNMESGLLTFSTAVKELSSYMFAVIGDTEARPHINDRVSKMVWDERPNFILNVGDLTDGGQKDHKFEWNYEYFQGVTQLTSRVVVFPVPGNGESDLHWYNQYHTLPKQGFYKFHYGNADFFMLNSNVPEDFAPGGRQYKWLEQELEASTAKWKFVAHHHAPYSADEDDYGDAWSGVYDLGDPRIRKIVPLYEKYGIDMVFFGHLHTYQRTLPIKENRVNKQQGVIYVQGGGGGGNLEDFAPSRAWFSAKTYRGHHYFIITVHEDHLNFKMYDTEGRLKDYLDLNKTE